MLTSSGKNNFGRLLVEKAGYREQTKGHHREQGKLLPWSRGRLLIDRRDDYEAEMISNSSI